MVAVEEAEEDMDRGDNMELELDRPRFALLLEVVEDSTLDKVVSILVSIRRVLPLVRRRGNPIRIHYIPGVGVSACKYPDRVPNRIPHHLNSHRRKEVVPSDISRNPVQEEDIPLDKESIRMAEVEVVGEDRV